MALPTAQLGQLGTMSMPYSIPTYEVGPNIWEKALGALLTSTASGVAQQGTQNLMSHENASEFGQQPASAWQRLIGGPTVSDQAATQRRGQAFTGKEAAKQRVFEGDQTQLGLDARAAQSDADAQNAMLRQNTQIQGGLDEATLRDMNSLLRGDRSDVAAGQRNDADNAARMKEIDLQNKGRAALPSEQINQVIIDRLRNQAGLGGGTGGSTSAAGVNPNVAKFAQQGTGQSMQARSQGYDMPTAPDYYSSRADLTGLSPEVVNAVLNRQGAVRDEVANGNYSWDPNSAANTQVQVTPQTAMVSSTGNSVDSLLNKMIPGRSTLAGLITGAGQSTPVVQPSAIDLQRQADYTNIGPDKMIDGYDPTSVMEILRRMVGPIGSHYDSNTGGYRK